MDPVETKSPEVSEHTLATLAEIGEEINASLDLDKVLARAGILIKRLIDYEILSVLLLDAETQNLTCRFVVGRSEEVIGNCERILAQHRSNPACQGCHKLMDPIGFALEPFDAIGRARLEDGGNPIDAHGVMYDGTPVDGPAGVRTFLSRRDKRP